jgi:hypothetical protein
MMSLYRKADDLDAKNVLRGAPGLADSSMDNAAGLSQSPSFLDVQDPVISPLSATEFNTLPFDFDLTALNQFLTSGDFDALIQTQPASQPNDVPVPPTPRPHPGPSDAIKAAWFTNMDEEDLENEAATLRTSPFGQGNANPQAAAKGREWQDPSDNTAGGHIDEAWRQNVNSILVPQVFNLGPLPSIDFLVCITSAFL